MSKWPKIEHTKIQTKKREAGVNGMVMFSVEGPFPTKAAVVRYPILVLENCFSMKKMLIYIDNQ